VKFKKSRFSSRSEMRLYFNKATGRLTEEADG
jgi:hypothetical protein